MRESTGILASRSLGLQKPSILRRLDMHAGLLSSVSAVSCERAAIPHSATAVAVRARILAHWRACMLQSPAVGGEAASIRAMLQRWPCACACAPPSMASMRVRPNPSNALSCPG